MVQMEGMGCKCFAPGGTPTQHSDNCFWAIPLGGPKRRWASRVVFSSEQGIAVQFACRTTCFESLGNADLTSIDTRPFRRVPQSCPSIVLQRSIVIVIVTRADNQKNKVASDTQQYTQYTVCFPPQSASEAGFPIQVVATYSTCWHVHRVTQSCVHQPIVY